MAPTPADASPSPGPLGRAAIILPGFDRSKQLQLDFSATPFGAVWFRRAYTVDECMDFFQTHLYARFQNRTAQEAKLREVRYGNNVTLLFRVCFWCSKYYGHPQFWPAIARGFSASPEIVESMVDTLVRARTTYQMMHSAERYAFRSGATKAADYWISFLGRTPDPYRRHNASTDGDAVLHKAVKYFADAKQRFQQTDSALMLGKHDVDRTPTSASKRRRSPSPNPTERYPSAKRRQTSVDIDRQQTSPAPGGLLPLVPLTTELDILGQAKEAYQTPVSANDGTKQGEAFFRQPYAEHSSRITIRGCATQDISSTPNTGPWIEGKAAEHGSSRTKSEQSAAALKLPIGATTPTQNVDLVGVVKNQDAPSEKTMESAKEPQTTSTRVTPHVDRLSLLEKKLAETETRRVQDVENARAMIASLEMNLSSTGHSAPENGENFQTLQERLASLEAKLEAVVKAVTPTDDGQIKSNSASLELGMVATDANSEGQPVSTGQDIAKRLACLEAKLASDENSSSNAQSSSETWAKILRVEDRLATMETSINKKDHVLDLTNRIVTLEQRQQKLLNLAEKTDFASKGFVEAKIERLGDHLYSLEEKQNRSQKLVATQTFVETSSKLLIHRLSSLERQIEAEKYKARKVVNINEETVEKKAAPEMQEPHLQKTVEIPKTSKSPSPPQAVQRDMEDMLKRIKGLPTMSSISEKTFQMEKNLRDMLEKHQRDTKERWEATLKDLDTAKAQIKGLVQLLNEATSDVAKQGSVEALESKLSTLSKRLDAANQSESRDSRVAKLEHKFDKLGKKVQDGLPWSTPADLLNTLQKLQSTVHDIEQRSQSSKNSFTIEVNFLHDRVDTLSQSFTALVRQLTRIGC